MCLHASIGTLLPLTKASPLRCAPQDSEPITALAISPDCTTLVSASRSLMLRVHDLQTGKLKRSWKVHKAAVADMAVDASGG